jgi:hypothetical protein
MSRSYTSSPPKRLHGVLKDCFTFTFTVFDKEVKQTRLMGRFYGAHMIAYQLGWLCQVRVQGHDNFLFFKSREKVI